MLNSFSIFVIFTPMEFADELG